MVHIFKDDGTLARALRLREFKLTHHLFGCIRSLKAVHALDLLEFTLRLRSLASLGAEAVCKQLQSRNFTLLVFVGRHLLLNSRLTLFQKRIVIPTVTIQAAATKFDHRVDKTVEKFTVVGNQHDRSPVSAKMFLKPTKGFQVEMVGRFVQQEQVRLVHKKARQVCAHDPTSTQGSCRPVKVGFPERQPL